MSLRLTLVIPCYNEAGSLPKLISRCGEALAAEPALDIILVDNGSTDVTSQVLAGSSLPDRLAVHVVPVNQGYGHGILSGLRVGTGDLLGWTHADLQTDPMDAVHGLAVARGEVAPEATFVKGRRHGRPLSDVVFTQGMSLFETVLLGTALWDINAQPTIFPRRFFNAWQNPPGDFSLDLFAYHWAKRAGLKVRRFPVEMKAREFGHSHWNLDFKSKLRFIRRTVAYSFAMKRSLQVGK